MNTTFLNLFLLALASFRLTRLLVFDKITEFIRAPFFDEVEEENGNGEVEVYYLPKKSGVKKFFGELLSCYWCTGIWTSAGIVLLYQFIPDIMVLLILILAVAGLGSIIETIVQHLLEK